MIGRSARGPLPAASNQGRGPGGPGRGPRRGRAALTLGDDLEAESVVADQLDQLGRVAVDELGAELDGMVEQGVVDGVDPAADALARLKHQYPAPRRRQPFGGGQAGDPRAEHQDIGRSRGRHRLLVAQGHDRVEPRGPARGPDAEEEPDQRAEPERHHHGGGRDQGIPLHDPREHDRGADAQQDADRAAQDAQGQRLDQELEQDVAAGGAQRLADADLAGALGHRDQHDVHDPDAADHEAHRGDAGQQAW